MRTGDKDECLGDNGNLKINDGMKLRVIAGDILATGAGNREFDSEFVEEEIGLEDDDDKEDTVNEGEVVNKRGEKKTLT